MWRSTQGVDKFTKLENTVEEAEESGGKEGEEERKRSSAYREVLERRARDKQLSVASHRAFSRNHVLSSRLEKGEEARVLEQNAAAARDFAFQVDDLFVTRDCAMGDPTPMSTVG